MLKLLKFAARPGTQSIALCAAKEINHLFISGLMWSNHKLMCAVPIEVRCQPRHPGDRASRCKRDWTSNKHVIN